MHHLLARRPFENRESPVLGGDQRDGVALVMNKLRTDIEKAFRNVHRSQTAAEVARLDLDVAREQLSVDLAQIEEGRVTLAQVEEARVAESDKWIAFYDAQYGLEKARWSLLRLTGDLLAAVEAQ